MNKISQLYQINNQILSKLKSNTDPIILENLLYPNIFKINFMQINQYFIMIKIWIKSEKKIKLR